MKLFQVTTYYPLTPVLQTKNVLIRIWKAPEYRLMACFVFSVCSDNVAVFGADNKAIQPGEALVTAVLLCVFQLL